MLELPDAGGEDGRDVVAVGAMRSWLKALSGGFPDSDLQRNSVFMKRDWSAGASIGSSMAPGPAPCLAGSALLMAPSLTANDVRT